QGFVQQVAGGAGNLGDDGALAAGQGVEQRALAGIGRPNQHRVQAVAQAAPALGRGQQLVQLRPGLAQALAQGLATEGVERLVGEVDRGLDLHPDRKQGRGEGLDPRRELALQRAPGGAGGAQVGGGDQVGDRLGLGQVQASVETGTLTELARARVHRAQLPAAREQLPQHRQAAVRLQFDHVLAGVAGRRHEQQRDAVVDHRAVAVAEAHVVRMARTQRAPAQRLRDFPRARPRQAHHADAGGAGAGGDGGDGGLVGHGLVVGGWQLVGFRAAGPWSRVPGPDHQTQHASPPTPRQPRNATRPAEAGPAYAISPRQALAAGASAYFFSMYHCCSRPKPPLVTQYSTRPAGKNTIITPNTSGISCIMRCCIGSMPVIGESFWVAHITAMLMIGRMNQGSRAVRSWIQPIHGAWRSSTDSSSTQYRAKKIGICSSTGRQPPTGLIFSFLYSSIIATLTFGLSSPERSLSCCMRGWNVRIRAIDLYWACASGNSTILTSTTRPTIAQPQLPNSRCSFSSTQNRPSPSQAIIEKRL